MAPGIKRHLASAHSLSVVSHPINNVDSRGPVNIFRLVLTGQDKVTIADMDFIADEIERLGRTEAF